MMAVFGEERPPLDEPARLLLYHTNAGEFRSSMGAQRSFAMGAENNTKPTYLLGLDESDGAEKWLRSDQRAIANGTVVPGVDGWEDLDDAVQTDILLHGRAATFSLAVESIDLGWRAGLGGATDYQGEMLARLIAYESLVPGNQLVLARPTAWWGAGIGGHTIPFEYPYWTIYRGKTCPGDQKKADLYGWILPRAIEVRAAWLGDITEEPPPEEEPMKPPVLLQATDLPDDNNPIFWWDGMHIGWVRNGIASVNTGVAAGLYQVSEGKPVKKFQQDGIQRLIHSGWVGGPVPKGYAPPTKAQIDSGVS